MSIKARFWVGLAAGSGSALIAHMIPAVQAYWLPIGAVVACLIWFGEFIFEFFGSD